MLWHIVDPLVSYQSVVPETMRDMNDALNKFLK